MGFVTLTVPDLKFQLVIFDCDGVLVDSEPLIRQAFGNTLTALGLPHPTTEQVLGYKGIAPTLVAEILQEQIRQPVPTEFVSRWKTEILTLMPKAQAIQGIDIALSQITLPVCVASSGDHEKIRKSLEYTKLIDYFKDERFFSAVDVTHGKPAPDLFLLAARECDYEPQQCVVIEDSVPGVIGAVAAGMTVFGYAAETPATELEEAGAITFTNMKDLPKLLAS